MTKHWLEFHGEPTVLRAGDEIRVDLKECRLSFRRPIKEHCFEPLLLVPFPFGPNDWGNVYHMGSLQPLSDRIAFKVVALIVQMSGLFPILHDRSSDDNEMLYTLYEKDQLPRHSK